MTDASPGPDAGSPPAARLVAVKGSGWVEVAAYGLADAEAQVEKEIRAAWPEARVEVTEVARTGEGRIVEGFAVAYHVRGSVPAGAESEEEARKAAFRWLRARFEGTRHARIAWEPG